MDLTSAGYVSNFNTFDWCIVGVYLLLSVGIGWYARRYVGDMADYVVAGRALKSRLAIATMIGSELGLITVMYSAQKGFTGGFAAFHIGLVAGIVALIVGFTGFIVVPLREMGVMTIPEFYQRRFSRGVRIMAGAILALAGILNMGLFLKAGSVFITGLTGMTSDFELKIVMTVLLVPFGEGIFLLVILALLGTFLVSDQPILTAAALDIVGEGVAASTLGVFSFARFVLAAASPLIAGKLFDEVGIESTFFFVAGIYLLATVVLLLVPLSAEHHPSENGEAEN